MISTYNVYPKLVLGIEVSVSLIGILLMLISVVGIIVRCSDTSLKLVFSVQNYSKEVIFMFYITDFNGSNGEPR